MDNQARDATLQLCSEMREHAKVLGIDSYAARLMFQASEVLNKTLGGIRSCEIDLSSVRKLLNVSDYEWVVTGVERVLAEHAAEVAKLKAEIDELTEQLDPTVIPAGVPEETKPNG